MLGLAKTKKVTLRAKIIRADGRVEDLGVIWQTKNKIKDIKEAIKKWLRF